MRAGQAPQHSRLPTSNSIPWIPRHPSEKIPLPQPFHNLNEIYPLQNLPQPSVVQPFDQTNHHAGPHMKHQTDDLSVQQWLGYADDLMSGPSQHAGVKVESAWGTPGHSLAQAPQQQPQTQLELAAYSPALPWPACLPSQAPQHGNSPIAYPQPMSTSAFSLAQVPQQSLTPTTNAQPAPLSGYNGFSLQPWTVPPYDFFPHDQSPNLSQIPMRTPLQTPSPESEISCSNLHSEVSSVKSCLSDPQKRNPQNTMNKPLQHVSRSHGTKRSLDSMYEQDQDLDFQDPAPKCCKMRAVNRYRIAKAVPYRSCKANDYNLRNTTPHLSGPSFNPPKPYAGNVSQVERHNPGRESFPMDFVEELSNHQSTTLPDNGCQCGPACNCLRCTKHPTNLATKNLCGELYDIMEGQQEQQHPPASDTCSRSSSSRNNISDTINSLDYSTTDPDGLYPFPSNDDPGLLSLEQEHPGYLEMAYPVGGCVNGYCRCGDQCPCDGCLTHTGHLPSPPP